MSIFSYVKSHVFVVSTAGVCLIIIAILAGRKASEKTPPPNTSGIPTVITQNAAAFRSGSFAVAAQGNVESHMQADLKSQVSAPVSLIDVGIGDTVYPGQLILELQNTDIRAQLEAARAAVTTAASAYSTTRETAVNSVKSGYLAADTAVHGQVDPIILNAVGTTPQLYSFITDAALANKIRNERTDLTTTFMTWQAEVQSLNASSSDSEIHTAIQMSESDLDSVRALLDDISQAINQAATITTTSNLALLTAWQTTLSAGRTAVSGARTSLSALEPSFQPASGGGSTARSGVIAAEANVQAAQAQLEKTLITSPITGKISALPLRQGELASPSTLLATVIGDTTNLEIKAFVSGDDLSRVKVGDPVEISPTVSGTVSNVAPSVDPTTRKAEVDIDVNDSPHSGLVIGDNISVSINTHLDGGTGQTVSYIVPIQDIKILPNEAYVLSVDRNSQIQKNDVTLGQIQGDFVQVVSGLNDSMNIVTPVYELDIGEKVNVQ
ncbi:MAG: HlyD family efflux transporter periplasmic adaptor subunit [Patescibacteria group bacterium]|nr:HlyD family efflux transporter periplasmic adaptor subunit [Patescibacteria group bacterium]MDE2172549.1 HlyD family efflux transporter periplasmic adaptor subunit [Patescibacteria group bacterium]